MMIDMNDDDRELLAQAASNIREYADDAAHDIEGDVLCCWDLESVGGVERVIAVRQYAEGTDREIVAVPLYGGVGQHVAVWHPRAGRAAAALLDDIAAGADPAEAAMLLARVLLNLAHDWRGPGDE